MARAGGSAYRSATALRFLAELLRWKALYVRRKVPVCGMRWESVRFKPNFDDAIATLLGRWRTLTCSAVQSMFCTRCRSWRRSHRRPYWRCLCITLQQADQCAGFAGSLQRSAPRFSDSAARAALVCAVHASGHVSAAGVLFWRQQAGVDGEAA